MYWFPSWHLIVVFLKIVLFWNELFLIIVLFTKSGSILDPCNYTLIPIEAFMCEAGNETIQYTIILYESCMNRRIWKKNAVPIPFCKIWTFVTLNISFCLKCRYGLNWSHLCNVAIHAQVLSVALIPTFRQTYLVK